MEVEKVLENPVEGVEETVEGVAPASPVELKGRAKQLAAYRKERELGEDVDVEDDELYDYLDGKHGELDGKYRELSGANRRFAELTASNPKFAAFIEMITNEKPKSIEYALVRIFGKDVLENGGEDLEKGNEEYLADQAHSKELENKSNENLTKSEQRINNYVESNGLDENQQAELNDALVNNAVGILTGEFTEEYIDFVWKGLNYDRDVQDAADAGLVEGKNKTVKAEVKSLKDKSRMNQAPVKNGVKTPAKEEKFWDQFTPVQ
jgi:hypothetical protein